MMLPLILLSVISLVASKEITIYTKDTSTDQQQDIGILSYEQDSRSSAFRALPVSSIDGSFSVCARDLDVSPECFAYQEVNEGITGKFGGDFQIRISEDGTIQSISFVRGDSPSAFGTEVIRIVPAATPNLTPYTKMEQKKQVQTQKVVRKRIVEDENGEKVEVEEEIDEIVEPDNRSWVQRNWMYIVPPLVLFLLLSPEEKK